MKPRIEANVSLRPYNTFGIEATARYFSRFDSIDALRELLQHPAPKMILGGGSNILLTRDVDGLVLRNEISGIAEVREDNDHVYLKTGGGENWHHFVMQCVARGYAGVENLALIPGSVGASPMQNIGAYGAEIRDVFHELEAVHLADGHLRTFTSEECSFGYRESVFKRELKGAYVIAHVTYRLNRVPRINTSYGAIAGELEAMGVKDPGIADVAQAVINIRASKLPDPRDTGNAGSFFKNPLVPAAQFRALQDAYPQMPSFPSGDDHVKVPAGWLIEQCGWKGYRKGDAGCYPKQALVLVNWGRASGREIWELSEAILQSVSEKFNILLEREVNVI